MKNPRTWFYVLLVVLNTAMWFIFVHRKPTAKAPLQPARPATEQVTIVTDTAPVVVVRTNAFDWQQLESEDYRTYIARLRSIGCPEQTIRDIVIADLEKLMAARVKAIDAPREPPKYWKPERKELVSTTEALEKIGQKQEVDFEKREIIRDLLGVDLAAERLRQRGERDIYEERLDFLSPDKRARVRMIVERANRAEVALREKSWLEHDELTPEERQELAQIEQTKEGEIAALLLPGELEQYNLWFSPSAYRVRDAFFAMEPSEEDFLAIYGIQRAFDEKWHTVDPSSLTPIQQQQYQLDEAQYENQIREYLGADRYNEFRRSRDDDFQQLQAAAAQFGLNLGVASEVYAYKKVLQDERTRVQQMPGLTLEQRRRINTALAEEAERSIIEVMGPQVYRYYIRSGSGKWISR